MPHRRVHGSFSRIHQLAPIAGSVGLHEFVELRSQKLSTRVAGMRGVIKTLFSATVVLTIFIVKSVQKIKKNARNVKT